MSFYTLAQMIAPKAPMDQRLRLSPEFIVVVPDQADSAFKERSFFSTIVSRGKLRSKEVSDSTQSVT